MKKIFSIAYRQEYFKGYSIGLNPTLEYNSYMKNEAFIMGFNSGRSEYERMNGFISDGIPKRIVNKYVLEDFLVAGLLGLSVDDDGYTTHQVAIVSEWYQSGVEKYEPNQSISLFELLEENGILIN